MKNSKLIAYALGNSFGAFAYTALVTVVLYNGNDWFGGANNFLMPLALLMLFVISATIVGLLILGRPIVLYLNKFKKEAIKLLLYTVGFLFIFTIIVFILLLCIR